MGNRQKRANTAAETLEILEAGHYQTASGMLVQVGDRLQQAVKGSKLFHPDDFTSLATQLSEFRTAKPTQFEVTNETTLDASHRLVVKKNYSVVALNFASARNPGGGFLGGSQAQEESLARSSGMFPCINQMSEMYEYNRHHKSLLYSDYMIYSPDVPVFRDDEGRLLERPYPLSIITAPAVNAGAVRKNQLENISQIEPTMLNRIGKVLLLALANGHQTLVLGAWGCGVFGNKPETIARQFATHLYEGGQFYNQFERIVFAVLDRSKSQEIYREFANIF
ncbi:MAG: TIGR02452 family protein [Chloroflexi bacterium]|nr:MAG: TIGR02452 family protein [Chloroflexota bacterium]